MSTPPPSHPRAATGAASTLQFRWDNFAIFVAILAVVGAIGTTAWSHLRPAPSVAPPGSRSTPLTQSADATAPVTSGVAADLPSEHASPDEARSLVEEARDFIAQGRWDEAEDRLNSIDPALATASGADSARADLDAARSDWNQIDAQVRADVAGKRWAAARAGLLELERVAPLDDEHLELRAQVDAALDAAASAAATEATTSRPKPASSRPSAPAARPRPASPAPVAGAGSTDAARPANGATATPPVAPPVTGVPAGNVAAVNPAAVGIDPAELERVVENVVGAALAG